MEQSIVLGALPGVVKENLCEIKLDPGKGILDRGKKLTEQVIVETVETEHVTTGSDTVLGVQLGPGLDHGEHGVVIGDSAGLGLLNHTVVDIDGTSNDIDIIHKGTGDENVPKRG